MTAKNVGTYPTPDETTFPLSTITGRIVKSVRIDMSADDLATLVDAQGRTFSDHSTHERDVVGSFTAIANRLYDECRSNDPR